MAEIIGGPTLAAEHVTAGRRFAYFEDVEGADLITRRFQTPLTLPALAKPTYNVAATGTNFSWKVQDIHGGGFVTGLYLHAATQDLWARTDVGGFYRRRPTDTRWQEILHEGRFTTGAPDSQHYQVGGLAIAPGGTGDRFVAISEYRAISSIDGGASLRDVAAPGRLDGNNGAYKRADCRIAIDPRDPNHILAGTPSAPLNRSTDGGLTWSPVNVPTTTTHEDWGVTAVLFDDRAGAPVDANGRTLRFWIAVNGASGDAANGFYRTDNGGSGYTQMTFTRKNGDLDSPGIVWDLQRFSNGDLLINGWSDLYRVANPAGSYTSTCILSARSGHRPSGANSSFNDIRFMAFNPNHEDTIIAGDSLFYTGSGYVFITYNGGSSWKTLSIVGADGPDGAIWPTKTSATSNWTSGSAKWRTDGSLWFADGMGVWTSTSGVLTAGSTSTTLTLAHASAGIEEIVMQAIHKVPDYVQNGVAVEGPLLAGGWDRSMWRWLKGKAADPLYHAFGSAWSIAACRKWPNVVAFIDTNHQPGYQPQRSAISTDGGHSFTQFGSLPAELMFGNIAISSQNPKKMVWAPSLGGQIHWSDDQGKTWTPATYSGSRGFHEKEYLRRNVLCADPHNEDTFYLLNQASSTSSANGVLKSVDGGKTWAGTGTSDATGLPTFGKQFNANMIAVDDGNGNTILLLTLGWFTDQEPGLFRGTFSAVDGSLSFTQVSGMPAAYRVAEGAPINGVPTLFCEHRDPTVAAYVANRQISRSTDAGVTWAVFSQGPMGRYDKCSAMAGDPNNPNLLYLAYEGTGAISRYIVS